MSQHRISAHLAERSSRSRLLERVEINFTFLTVTMDRAQALCLLSVENERDRNGWQRWTRYEVVRRGTGTLEKHSSFDGSRRLFYLDECTMELWPARELIAKVCSIRLDKPLFATD